MKVLHVDSALEWRGGQAQLAHLLAARPGDLLAAAAGGELGRRARVPDVVLHPGNDPRNALLVRAGSRRLGVDLVAAHHSHAHNASLLVGVPLVVHRRNHRPPGSGWKYRRVAQVVAVSQYVAGLCGAAGLRGVSVVYDGVPVGAPVPPSARDGRAPVFGTAGALVEHKGHVVLLEALSKVRGTLLVAGDGKLRAALSRQAESLGGRVSFLGALPSLSGFFADIDVFVHPSLDEAAGSVLVEAMAAGVPVVATTAGGQPELVGEAGMLVPPGDVHALASALRAPRSRGEGTEQAARFPVARMVRETEAVYARALGR